MPWWYVAALLSANSALLLANASPLRVIGALLLIGLLPGLSWANRYLTSLPVLFRWTIAAAVSFGFTSLATLLLHYLPGPMQTWQILLALNLLAILPGFAIKGTKEKISTVAPRLSFPLLLILLIALLLRTLNLDYSEFQGDESLAMITAAEALEGHEDALFLRSKGPGEVLLPMALWRLTGIITEPIARLPFTTASLLAVISIYLIGKKVGGPRLGWLAAGFFAFNGFMVAFGRIVQYQALVIWLSALAFLLSLEWRETRQLRLVALSGLCLGLGLLAHYDAVLVIPAIIWVLITTTRLPPHLPSSGERLEERLDSEQHFEAQVLPSQPSSPQTTPSEARPRLSTGPKISSRYKPIFLFIGTTLVTALPFYLPFVLDPQAQRTGDYVGGRVGNELRNNLPYFFHFTSFYSSAYYLIITGLLILGLLTWLLGQTRGGRWPGMIAAISILLVSVSPEFLTVDKFNLSILPFVLLLVSAFYMASAGPMLPAHPSSSVQALILWLAIPFLFYNFVVALGLTHIYTIVPAWSLLAGLGWHYFFDSPRFLLSFNTPIRQMGYLMSNLLLGGLLLLSAVFLWNAFIRHDIEYWQDYPAGNLPFYWTPYSQPPNAGFFGFAHRTGWKVVGQKIVVGELRGDYGSNEEPDVTTWYTRGAPRACDSQPEFYFLADDLIDPVEVPHDLIAFNYQQIGQVTLLNQKQMQIMQLRPPTLALGQLDALALANNFDQTATPAAFARSTRGAVPLEANFSRLIRLMGYSLDTRRAYSGGRLPVTLYWQAQAAISTSYHIFTHLETEAGPVAQADGVPVCWSYPTNQWRPGQIIADPHAIHLPPETPPGHYPLQVGLYLADTFERLDVLDHAGNPAGTSITLTKVEVKDAGP